MTITQTYAHAIGLFAEHAKAAYPEEACGLILTTGEFAPLTNVAQDKRREFAARPEDVLPFAGRIAAKVHSHICDPYSPTAADMAAQMQDDVPWGIVVVGPAGGFGEEAIYRTSIAQELLAGRITLEDELVEKAKAEIVALEPFFWGDQLPRAPFEGRRFIHGVHDCYSLIRDWYLVERNVRLPDFPRDEGWWRAGKDLYRENFRAAGFQAVDQDAPGFKPAVGDVLLYQIDSDGQQRPYPPHHGGIYIGNGRVLHHLAGCASNKLGVHRWWKNVSLVLRRPK